MITLYIYSDLENRVLKSHGYYKQIAAQWDNGYDVLLFNRLKVCRQWNDGYWVWHIFVNVSVIGSVSLFKCVSVITASCD